MHFHLRLRPMDSPQLSPRTRLLERNTTPGSSTTKTGGDTGIAVAVVSEPNQEGGEAEPPTPRETHRRSSESHWSSRCRCHPRA